jgi:hypothetical protein
VIKNTIVLILKELYTEITGVIKHSKLSTDKIALYTNLMQSYKWVSQSYAVEHTWREV